MKKYQFTFLAALLALMFSAGHATWADDYLPEPAYTTTQTDELFTAEELDDLLAPIALYPDPLLAQILPAATFIDQIDEAARYINQYGQAARIDDQPWDVSVKAVAHYSNVLFMMDQKYDWSVSLGQAYINQPQDVFDAIQRLRAEARAIGNLVSSPQQEVFIEDDYIRIVPAEPEVIYVPVYDPLVVYEYPPSVYGFMSFGIGFTIGAWLNRDCDWHRHRIYYHGWRGSGWIGRSRRHVNTRSNVYIRNTYSTIHVNPRVVRHDTVRYRDNIRRDVEYRREHRPEPAVPGRDIRPGGGMEGRGARPVTRTGTPRPVPAPVTSQPRTVSPAPRTDTPRPVPAPVTSQPRTVSPAPRTDTPRPVPAPVTSQPRTAPPAPRTDTPRPVSAPATSLPRTAPRPESTGGYRGREPKGTQLPANTGYGGYGSGGEVKTYRERGQSSRENMQKSYQQPSVPVSGARPGASVGRQPAPASAAPRQSPPAAHHQSPPAAPHQAPPANRGADRQK